MGLTLQFVIGSKIAIIDAVQNADYEFLAELETANKMADFSLHLEPKDLDLLVNAASELKSKKKIGLREHLDTKEFYYDSEEEGVFLVDPIIAALFAEFGYDEAPLLTKIWFEKMAIAHNEAIDVNDGAIEAVERLVFISKEVQNTGENLMHVWSL